MKRGFMTGLTIVAFLGIVCLLLLMAFGNGCAEEAERSEPRYVVQWQDMNGFTHSAKTNFVKFSADGFAMFCVDGVWHYTGWANVLVTESGGLPE